MKTLIIALLLITAAGCNPEVKAPLAAEDNICIGTKFYIVKSVEAYPWVHLGANHSCEMLKNVPDTLVDFSEVATFQPRCVCRYSADCRRSCENSVSPSDCRDACTN